MVSQALIWGLWPGKIPRTSCFVKQKQNGQKWFRMGANGFAGRQWGAFARGGRKTRGSESKIGYQDTFCRCGDGQQNIT